ncbi:MAG TPA: glycosyltransferase [Lutibacter sp.]
MKPLVSICIPTYNGAAYIASAMELAISQTYPNLEIVVSDDASSDDTLKIIKSFQNKTNIPIHIYHHEPNGIGANWNHCVKQAEGDYIKFLFQDDLLEVNCISEMMEMALTDKSIGLVYCKRKFLYAVLTDKVKDFIAYYGNVHRYWESINLKQGVLSGKVYLKDKQLLNSPKNKIGEPTNVLLKKECFIKVGYFSEVLQQALDSDYWYRVMKYYDVGFIDKTLVSFRLHEQQASSINKGRVLPDKELVYKNYYKNIFWQLHPKNQLKLLKLYHPLFKWLVKLKQQFNAK